MKIQKKLFDSLTREPDLVQEVEGKKIEFFFMTEEEADVYEREGRYTVWTSDGKDNRVLISEDYYNYGSIKEYYSQDVNAKFLEYIDKVSNAQRKSLMWIMIPTMVIYVIVSILSIVLFADYAMYVLIGLLLAIIVVNVLQSRYVRNKITTEQENFQLEMQELLTLEVYDHIADDQIKYREMKNKSFRDEVDNFEQPDVEETEEENLEDEVNEVEEIVEEETEQEAEEK